MKKVFFLLLATFVIIGLSGCSTNNNGDIDGNGGSPCSCSRNIYNCDDFSTHREAQACYNKCGGVNNDVHKLDRDKDGSACETLP